MTKGVSGISAARFPDPDLNYRHALAMREAARDVIAALRKLDEALAERAALTSNTPGDGNGK